MRKIIFVFSLIAILAIGGTVAAQDQMGAVTPMLQEGVKELGISGDIDLDGPGGGVDIDLAARYGYFFTQNLEVGAFINFSKVNDVAGEGGAVGDVIAYGLGAFADYHFFGNNWVGWAVTVPYFGASLGLNFTDTDLGEDQSGLTLTPRAGVKWFFTDYLAVDTNFFFAWSTDDIYVNDGDLEEYDFGFNLGLRAYFE